MPMSLDRKPDTLTPVPMPPRSMFIHIPGTDGWPIVGNTLQLLADTKGAVEGFAEKYGPVYRCHLFGQQQISLLGPAANEFILLDQAKVFSAKYGWGAPIQQLFPRNPPLFFF